MFTFAALHDTRRRKRLLHRPARPPRHQAAVLLRGATDRHLVFGSEIKALLESDGPGASGELDLDALGEFLILGVCPRHRLRCSGHPQAASRDTCWIVDLWTATDPRTMNTGTFPGSRTASTPRSATEEWADAVDAKYSRLRAAPAHQRRAARRVPVRRRRARRWSWPPWAKRVYVQHRFRRSVVQRARLFQSRVAEHLVVNAHGRR